MDPLNWVLDWFNHGVIRASIMGQLMEKEFFPKWLETLHRWLTTPKASYEEIVQWCVVVKKAISHCADIIWFRYTFWKGTLPPNVSVLPAVQEGFQSGVRLMSDWADMEQSQRINLPKSWLSTAPSQQTGQKTTAKKGSTIAARVLESSFKSIVEEYATEHELLFMPTGRVHEKSRVPMYRVTARMDGKGGIVVYILDDMVWAVEGGADSGDVEGIGLEEMVLLARKGK
jgi:tuftelin-interacting protein 11